MEIVSFFRFLIFRILEALLNYIFFKLFPDILTHESLYSYLFLVTLLYNLLDIIWFGNKLFFQWNFYKSWNII